MDVTFHCDQTKNFPVADQLVRGFSYKDYFIEPHTHEFYEMNIILGGTGTHCMEDCRIQTQVGDVFVIPPGVVHAYCDCEHLEVYHILLHKDFVASNQMESLKAPGYLHFMEIEPFLRSNDSTLFLHLSGSQLIQLQSDLTFLDDSATYDQRLKNHVAWKIVYWLSWLLAQQMEQAEPKNKYESSILTTLEYIHEHYDEKLTNDRLCQMVYLSRSTFLRNFEAICGCTPAAYIRSYRRKKAVELFVQGTMTKTEIAHACGFYDLSHMERCIKPKKEDI